MIEQKHQELKATPSDINEHLDTLKKYAEQCDHVTEMGVRKIVSTWALLAGKPKRMISIDIRHPKTFGGNLNEVVKATEGLIDYEFKLEDTTKNEIEETDLLFIDTWHHYEQLKSELRHAGKVRKYIILHDTTTFAVRGESDREGLKRAIDEFLADNKEWRIKEEYKNNNGLTVLVRVNNNMQFIVPTPDSKYYLWQMLVQIANFREMGYEENLHIPVIYFGSPSETLKKLSSAEELKCNFYLFKDNRDNKIYSASMKPYLMYKYFEMFPERKSDTYNYLDSDVIFTQPMDFSPFIGDDIWYGSDTGSYTGPGYVKSKGEGMLESMCRICEVDPEVVIANEKNHIGAQYFIKNNTPELWKEIYEKANLLYAHFVEEEKKWTKEEHPIQKWTAEMWATIYVALGHGYELKSSDLMQFHWANHTSEWTSKPYFHNAGMTTQSPDDINFCKRVYEHITPFNRDITVKEESVSSHYLKWVRKTEEMFPGLMF